MDCANVSKKLWILTCVYFFHFAKTLVIQWIKKFWKDSIFCNNIFTFGREFVEFSYHNIAESWIQSSLPKMIQLFKGKIVQLINFVTLLRLC